MTTVATFNRLAEREKNGQDLEFLKKLDPKHVNKTLELLPKSRSQLRQDLFVLNELNFKRNGFFVEFGATNGVDLSNTFMLESDFGWTGILSEPSAGWLEALQKNRKAIVDSRCVWSSSGETLRFREAEEQELSTIEDFANRDAHWKTRRTGVTYEVATVSLVELLDFHNAPKVIDFLSIDTEGSEFEILNAFDFGRYSFRTIVCEHNYTPNRKLIYDLLTRNGYARKFDDVSNFDDWYVAIEN